MRFEVLGGLVTEAQLLGFMGLGIGEEGSIAGVWGLGVDKLGLNCWVKVVRGRLRLNCGVERVRV